MVLLDILGALLILFLILALIGAGVLAYLLLPLSDLVNSVFRKVGLAGPSPESRAAGVGAVGTVVAPFDVRDGEDEGTGKVFVGGEIWNARCPGSLAGSLSEGDRVAVVYRDDLTVTVTRRIG